MYQERVLQYRVMRQLNDAERNPEGAWSLVFSSSDKQTALEVLMEEVERWGKTGDAFKMKDAGVAETVITREVW
jgi:hypothetical protein